MGQISPHGSSCCLIGSGEEKPRLLWSAGGSYESKEGEKNPSLWYSLNACALHSPHFRAVCGLGEAAGR